MSRTSIKKNSVYNIIKYASSVIFPLITFPYISRTLGVVNIGKINFANSIITYMSLIASLGVYTYATRECAKDSENREALSKVSSEIYSINMTATVIAYAAMIVLLILPIRSIQEVRTLIIIQSMTVLFTTLGADWINTAEGDFRFITIRTVLMQFFSLVMMFIFVHHPADYIKYTLITVVAASGANCINIFYRRRFCDTHLTRRMNAKTHLPSIMTFFSTILCQTIYTSADITMLRIMKDNYQVGLYSTSVKIYNILNGTISSVVTVILPEISMYYKNGQKDKISAAAKYALEFMMVLFIPIFAVLNVFSKELVGLLAGSDYIGACTSLRILSIAMLFSLVGNYVGSVYIIPCGKEKIGLIAGAVSAGANIILNIFFIPEWGINGAAFTTAVSEFLGMIIGFPYVTHLVKVRSVIRTFFTSLLSSGIMCVIMIFIEKLIGPSVLTTMMIFVIGLLIYGIAMIIMKDEFVLSFAGPVLKKLRHN